MVEFNECQESLRQTRLGRRFQLHNSFVCAGGEPNVDTCQGDGGSPLACPIDNNNRYVQTGIVAFGIGCGGNYPAVYTNVAHFRNWIDTHIHNYGLDTSIYAY
jgi:secreted trypsin-like serine protease